MNSADSNVVGLLPFYLAIALLYFIPYFIIQWSLAKKAGKPGWTQIVPLYGNYVQGIIAKSPKLAVTTTVLLALYYVCQIMFGQDSGIVIAVSLVWVVFALIQLRRFILQFNANVGKWILFIFIPLLGLLFIKNTKYIGGDLIPQQQQAPVQPAPVAITPPIPPMVPPLQ